MRSFIGICVPLIVALILAGCGGDGQNARITPKTIPDPSPVRAGDDNQSGYDDSDSYYADYVDENMPLELLTVHFAYDSYELSSEALDVLSANAEALVKHPNAVIRIEGHCDERGTEEYNMALGEKRAQAVRGYLLNYGINPQNVSIISYGELLPVDRGHAESAWKKNRRAAFVVQSE